MEVDSINNHSGKLKFRLVLTNFPDINYFCQSVMLPEVSLPSVVVPTPRQRVTLPGSRVEYGETFTVNFIVDSTFENYKQILEWIRTTAPVNTNDRYEQRDSINASVVITDEDDTPLREFKFIDVRPTNLGTIDLTSLDEIFTSITCDVSFSYNYFDLI